MLWDFLTTLFDTEWFFGQLEKSPVQLLVYTVVIFTLGAAAGARAGKKAKADLESKVSERDHEITRLTTQLEGERTRSASVDGLEGKLAHAQERIAELEATSESTDTDADEAEKKHKAIQYARNLALGLSYDDKSFLLALEKHGCIQFEDVSSWDVSSDLRPMRKLVEQTEVACNVHRVWLNERGKFVLQEAHDILEMLIPEDDDKETWWSYGTFVGNANAGLISDSAEPQDRRPDEEQERDEARRAAMALKSENKLLLLELSKGQTLTVSMNRYTMESHITDLYGLVEHTEVGLDAQELWISDYGMRVVELAGDILSKVRPDAVYPWWQQARFLSVEQGDPQPQEESDQGPLSSWPWPISADDIEPTN